MPVGIRNSSGCPKVRPGTEVNVKANFFPALLNISYKNYRYSLASELYVVHPKSK
jgi:hypothetical protein